MEYDAAGQMNSVANLQENDDVISRFTYLYDAAGNRTQEAREDGTLRVWKYDLTGQLVSEQRTAGGSWENLTADQWGGMSVSGCGMLPATSGAGPITTYVYDPVGNRLVLNADGELTTSTYDAANRLIASEEINGITTYTFDASGNQRTVETPDNEITTYSWSYENQLIQIEEPEDVITTNLYAPINRKADELRIIKETDAGIVNFLYDDQNIIQEIDDTSTIEAEYTLNPQPYGDLISQRRDDESTFYHFDALGSTQSLTDESATVDNEYTYGAFGKILAQSGSVENPFTWVGELGYYQEENGRSLLRQRWYEEQVNRFLSQDPIKDDPENLYRYVANSPLLAVDPSGLSGASKLAILIRRALCEGTEQAIKKSVREELRNDFYKRIGAHISEAGLRDLVQLHHIVPQAMFGKSYPDISKFLEDIGALKHSSSNITILPTPKAATEGYDIGSAALHSGGHLKSYYEEVVRSLNEIMDRYKTSTCRKGADTEAAKELARSEVRALQASLRSKLQSGEIKLQAYDTPESRRNLATGIMGLFIFAGMSPDEAEAAAMDFIENEVNNNAYYRQKNIFVRYGTVGYYARNSDSSIARWSAFAVDFFNPVEDVMFFTDLAEDAISGTVSVVRNFNDLLTGVSNDIRNSLNTIRTNPNAKFNLERQLLFEAGCPALYEGK